jgi:flagellar biosynthetic protein FliR
MHFTEAEILSWVGRFLWPMLRFGALMVSVPVFSSHGVPARVRLVIALALTALAMPALPAMPDIPLFSAPGLLAAAQQVFIGLLTGFVLQTAYAVVIYGGQNIAYAMGLGFASLIDPQTGVQVPVVAQLYLLLTTFIFLSMDGHLLVIQMLVDSFHWLPVEAGGPSRDALWTVLVWSGLVFSGGLLLSLPILIALLVVTLGFGVAARAAPQLNIFSVGFPVTLLLGLVLMWVTLPDLTRQIGGLLHETYLFIERLLRG